MRDGEDGFGAASVDVSTVTSDVRGWGDDASPEILGSCRTATLGGLVGYEALPFSGTRGSLLATSVPAAAG